MATAFATLPRRTNHEVGEKIARVVDLIVVLVRTEEGFTSEELARQLGVQQRTVQRYLSLLQHSSLDLVTRSEPISGGVVTKYSARI